MKHGFSWLAFLPGLVLAQASFPTEFPAGAARLEPAELQRRLTGQVFDVTYAGGQAVRLEYREGHAYVNAGNASDSGTWRVEASSVCVEWRRFQGGCSEVRLDGEALLAKRIANGEIVRLNPRP